MRPLPLAVLLGALPAQVDWIALSIPGAPFRFEQPLTYDLTRGKTFLFGGNQSPNGYANDLWCYDGLSWVQIATPVAPAPRRTAVLVADLARGELLLFGGDGGPGNDTWTWNGTWTQRSPTSVPPIRNRAAATYDTTRGLVLMFGGQGTAFWPMLGDMWQWDGTDWTPVSATMPPARAAAGLAYDSVRDRAVLFGGYASSVVQLGDTWEWDGALWQQRSSSGPSARFGTAMVFEAHRQRTVLTGGFILPLGGDTWEWDGYRWQQVTTTVQPANQAIWGIAYDFMRQRTVLYGGYGGTTTWEYGNRFSGHSVALAHGCAGTVGTPTLRAVGAAWPQLGSAFPLEVIGLRPNTTSVFATMGFSRTWSSYGALPLDLAGYGLAGCLLFADPMASFAVPAQSGIATHQLVIPNDPGLLGCRFFEQILQPEPGAPRPASLSNALEFVIG